jgi:hypothetical protein
MATNHLRNGFNSSNGTAASHSSRFVQCWQSIATGSMAFAPAPPLWESQTWPWPLCGGVRPAGGRKPQKTQSEGCLPTPPNSLEQLAPCFFYALNSVKPRSSVSPLSISRVEIRPQEQPN